MDLAADDPARLHPGEPDLENWAAPDPQTRPDLWPSGLKRGSQGEMTLHGRGLSELLSQAPQAAGRGGQTPIFVLDMADFRARLKAFREAFTAAFGEHEVQVHYAGKAFLCVEIARLAAGAGLGLDTASAGEMALALASGCKPSLIGLHGNGKSPELLRRAIEARLGRIIVDSPAEVRRIQRILDDLAPQSRVPLMVRITTGVHAGGHEFIATAHEDQKFGLSLTPGAHGFEPTDAAGSSRCAASASDSPVLRVVQSILADERLELSGLHSHIGSQIVNLDGFCAAARKILEFRALVRQTTGYLIPEIDLGGGYGIAYTSADVPAPGAADFAAGLYQVIQNTCDELEQPFPRVSVEPGRAIAGPSTTTLYRVVNIKDQPVSQRQDGSLVYRRYVSIDGGMSDNIRPALYGANYTIALANRLSTAPLAACRVVGSHCESGDIVVKDVALPKDLTEGDLLAVPATGAYGWAMSSNYNWFTRPGVLGVDQDNTGTVITKWLLEPETVDAMLAHFDPQYRKFLDDSPADTVNV